MNIIGIFNLWLTLIVLAAFVLFVCNPFLEGPKRRIALFIVLAVLVVLLTIGVGWIW